MRARAAWHRDLVHLFLLRPLLWAFFGITVRGREHLAGLARFILVSNHNSHLDTPVLYACLPRQQIGHTRPVAAYEYFSRSPHLLQIIDALFRPVWIDRTQHSGQALTQMQQALEDGDNLLLFPEGTRGDAGVLQRFRSGVGKLVAENPQIPVVPVYLQGPERALPRRTRMPLPLWQHVTFAPPQLLSGSSDDVTSQLWRTLQQMESAAAEARRQRPRRRAPVFTAAVLGIDGSGKSTLAAALARTTSATERSCVISDRLETFEFGAPRAMQPVVTEALRQWMASRAKSAHSLGGYKLPKLAELLLRDHLLDEATRWYRPDSIFIDGMPLLNLCAWSVLYRPNSLDASTCASLLAILSHQRSVSTRGDSIYREFPELGYLRRLGRDHLHMPSAVIFLDVPPAACMGRIRARGEQLQLHETEEKLTQLRAAYHLVCSVLEREWKLPLRILTGDRGREEVVAEAEAWIRTTREAMHHG